MKSRFLWSAFMLAMAWGNVCGQTVYTRVNGLSGINEDDVYIICSELVGYAMMHTGTDYSQSNSLNTSKEVSSDKLTITYTQKKKLDEFRLIAIDTANRIYALQNIDDMSYLAVSGSNLTSITNKGNAKAQWTISFSGGYVFLYNANTNKTISNNTTFKIGASPSSGKRITLFKKVALHDITIGSSKYLSYVTPAAINFAKTEGITAYKVTEADAEHVSLLPITKAPAGTPVIINGEPGDYSLYQTFAEVEEVSGNLLLGSNGTVTGDGKTVYGLADLSKGVGFYLVEDGLAVPEGKAYLVINKQSEARSFVAFAPQTTAIPAVVSSPSVPMDDGYYLLDGRKVQHPRRGIYIHHGRKVIVK